MVGLLKVHREQRLPDRLRLKDDDFSIQAVTVSDPLFWIRIERTSSQPVLVSDIKRSGLAPDAVGRALDAAVDACAFAEPVTVLHLLDIAPGGDQVAVEREAAALAATLVEYARLRHQRVIAIDKRTRQKKTDLIVALDAV